MRPIALVASLTWLITTSAFASSFCPSPHFQPATYYGQAFFDSRPVTEYEVLGSHDELALQIIEYQTFEPGYEPVFTTSLVRSHAGEYRAALVRAKEAPEKGGSPAASALSRDVPASLVARAVAAASSVLRKTRYADNPCSGEWLDGYVVQALVPDTREFGDLVGEAYSPPEKSEADAIVALGRALRSYVEGKTAVVDVELAVTALEAHANSSRMNAL